MRTVRAKFPSGDQIYSYFIPEGDNPKEGDIILTSVSWKNDGDAFKLGEGDISRAVMEKGALATVQSVHASGHQGRQANKFYVMLIPLQFLLERHQDNVRMVAKAKRQAEIRALLDDKLRAQSEREKYARLAMSDPEAAALLDELDAPTLDQLLPKQAEPQAKPKPKPDVEAAAVDHGLSIKSWGDEGPAMSQGEVRRAKARAAEDDDEIGVGGGFPQSKR